MTTIGVFSTHAQARSAIDELRAAGVTEADISYMYVNVAGEITDAHGGTKVGDGAAAGAATGAVLGALAGFVVANGILPGLGTLFVAGPLAAALGFTGAAATTVAGAATGLAAGGIIGALSGLGISDEDALMYEEFLRSGDVLVISKSSSPVVREIFSKMGAKQIGSYEE